MSRETTPERPAPVFALMYSSHAVDAVDEQLLADILEQARAKNAELGITGILLFRAGKFFQYLEGPEATVRALYADIREDPRHERLRILLEHPVAVRRFSAWTMGHAPLREPEGAIPPGVRSTFADLENTERPENVLRAVTELMLWYRARAAGA